MDYRNIISQLHTIVPPQQPLMNISASEYVEKLVDWNPICVKNSALYFQFSTDAGADSFVGILPDACINIIFKCDPEEPAATISGIHEGCTKIILEPNTTYFGFKPYSVLGMKNTKARFAELKNKTVDLDSVFNSKEITERIVAGASLHERIKLFQNYAMANLVDEKYTPNFVEYCAILICLSGGNIGLEEIERETGYSERHCREKFKEVYGISIKHYSRIVRFQNALRMVTSQNDTEISDVVYEAGYFDQSHFIKEFKRFAQTSPSKFRNTYLDLLVQTELEEREDGLVIPKNSASKRIIL